MERWLSASTGDAIRDDKGALVAQFWTRPIPRHTSLMIAAPELLAALKAMVEFHDGEDDVDRPDLAAARATIAQGGGPIMISAQNTILPHLGADIRPPQPERRRERKAIMAGDEWIHVEHIRERDGKGGWIEVRDVVGEAP